MKQLISKIHLFALLLMMVSAVTLTACSDGNDTPEVTSGSIKVSVKLASAYSKVKLGKVNLVLRNTNTGKETAVDVMKCRGQTTRRHWDCSNSTTKTLCSRLRPQAFS